jgi:hypothetical protein
MFEYDRGGGSRRGTPHAFINLGEDDLRTRIIDRWDRGELIT